MSGMPLFEVALDVFDGDCGVVDEDADGERQTAEGHDVDGLAKQAEDDDRGQDRQRDGDGDDDGAAPASEEEQDHEAGEHGGDDGFADDAIDGAAHKDRLVADQPECAARAAVICAMRGSSLRMPLTTSRVEALPDFRTRDEHAALAVLPHDVGLRDVLPSRDGGDILDVDGGAVDLADGDVADAFEREWRRVQMDVVLVHADLRGAAGLDDVLLRQAH